LDQNFFNSYNATEVQTKDSCTDFFLILIFKFLRFALSTEVYNTR